jgi:hypothetical protein
MFYDVESFCPIFTIQEAIDIGLLPSDLSWVGRIKKDAKFLCSSEYVQDVVTFNPWRYLDTIRTSNITQDEIIGWKETYKSLKEDFGIKKQRLVDCGFSIEGEEPYKYWGQFEVA